MLGVQKAGNLQEKTEFTHLLQKTQKFAKAITACPVKSHEVWEGYQAIYMPSIKYSLATTSFVTKDFQQLHSALLPSLLPRLGFLPTFPHDILFGPVYFGGRGLYDLEAEEGLEKIKALIKHVRTDTTVGRAFMILVRWAQLQAGTSKSILEDTKPIDYIESKWIVTLRAFLRKINAQIKQVDAWVIKTQRENDTHIMEVFARAKHISSATLAKLNYCRMYLAVTTLADIASSDGKKIVSRALRGNSQLCEPKRGLIKWPVQAVPDDHTWKLWDKACFTTLCHENGNLFQPLGKWTHVDENWKFRYSESTELMYQYDDNFWSSHELYGHTRRVKYANPEYIEVPEVPSDATPITDVGWLGASDPQVYVFTHPTERESNQEAKEPCRSTWDKYISKLQKWEQVLLKKVMEDPNLSQTLRECIERGVKLWFVTDGGAKDGKGYFGWVIATATQILWRGKGKANGNPHQMESLRTESVGMLSLMRFLYHYCTYHGFTPDAHQADHFCDNKALVSRMNWYERRDVATTNASLTPDHDVQIQIEETMNSLNLQCPTTWVEGHQDTTEEETAQLPWEAQLNIEADKLATEARHEMTEKDLTEFNILPASKLMLFINGAPITRSHATEIRNAWTTQRLRDNMTRRFSWTSGTADNIDWYSHGSTLKAHEFYNLNFSIKFIHERLPLNGVKFHQSTTDQCPCCKEKKETCEHFITCFQNPEVYQNLQEGLVEVYKKHQVDPVLRILINLAIAGEPIHDGNVQGLYPLLDFEPYETLIEAQTKIGWKQIRYGRYALDWDYAQRRYSTEVLGIEATGEPKWIRAVIRATLVHYKSRWLTRNELLHGKDPTQVTSIITKSALHARIEALYTHEQNVLVQDRFPFATPIEEWKDKTANQMKQWLRSNQPHIKICLTLAKKQNKLHTKDIRSYVQGETRTAQQKETKKKKRSKVNSKDIRKYTKGKNRKTNAPTHRKDHPTEAAMKPIEQRQSSLTSFTFTNSKPKPRFPRNPKTN